MKIAVLDDYQDVFRNLGCFAKLAAHEVVSFRDTEKDPVKLADRLQAAAETITEEDKA